MNATNLGHMFANNGLLLSPMVAVAAYSLLKSHISAEQATVAAIAILMALWWITEALPLAVTALLPIAAFPLFGLASTAQAARPFAHPLIFLFLGGFLLALAMQRWQLHRRMALHILARSGASATGIIGGFMVATAFLSMWVSNTATAMLMLPIGMSVIELFRRQDSAEDPEVLLQERNFCVALLLAIAYGANIGGVGTLIGSPPNALLAAFLRDSGGPELTFASWLWIGLPTVGLMLPLSWLLLVRFLYPLKGQQVQESQSLLANEILMMGDMSKAEKMVAFVFVLTAFLWIFQPFISRVISILKFDDTIIAIIAALLLFALPVDWKKRQFLLDWESTRQLPWGILLLFGGGLSLAETIQSSGLSQRVGDVLQMTAGLPLVVLVVAVTILIICLTEVTSNTATAAAFLPIILSLSETVSQPTLILAAPAVLAASFAFMLPVATPPNAVIYAGGEIKIGDMIRAGLYLNILGTIVITLVTMTVVRYIVLPSG